MKVDILKRINFNGEKKLGILKRTVFAILFVMALIMLINYTKLPDAHFNNLQPSLIIGDATYSVTSTFIGLEELDKKYAKVRSYTLLVSYTEEENPYKNVGIVWSIKNRDYTGVIALEMNGQYYLCKKYLPLDI
jgi:hypothetical protein